MKPEEQRPLIIAIAVNLAVGQLAAVTAGLPRWIGTVAAGGAMAAASQPDKLPQGIKEVVQLAVLPGNIAANILTSEPAQIKEPTT